MSRPAAPKANSTAACRAEDGQVSRPAAPKANSAAARRAEDGQVSRPARGLGGGLLLVASLALSSCALLDKPSRPLVYDFGPGMLVGAQGGSSAALPMVALPAVEAATAIEGTAVLYRLLYADAQQLLPYAQARWSMAPAQLVAQRLRETLGQRRTVFNPGDGTFSAATPTLVLRVELEEFSQLFESPERSVGLVRMRATVVQALAAGDKLLGQRSFVVQRLAPSADAPGGVRALTAATNAAVEEIEQWLTQLR